MPAEMIEKLIESNYQRIQRERRQTGGSVGNNKGPRLLVTGRPQGG
jgi:hypothetical protein